MKRVVLSALPIALFAISSCADVTEPESTSQTDQDLFGFGPLSYRSVRPTNANPNGAGQMNNRANTISENLFGSYFTGGGAGKLPLDFGNGVVLSDANPNVASYVTKF